MLKGSGLERNFDNQWVGVKAWRQLSAIAAFGMMVLPIASCGNNTEDMSATPPSQEAQNTAAVAPFPKPTAQSPTVAISPSLIQPTNGSQRAKQVQTGRQDPFAGLFIQTRPRETASQVASQASPPQTTGNSSGAGSSDAIATRPPSSPPGGGATVNNPPPVTPPDNDNGIPFPPPDEGAFPPALPSVPEPELARKVAVSGVVQIGDQLQAIVQVPNEGTSRYVRVGQRLSNGEILVKRIEMSPGIEPVVILEQYGVEVAKAIGEQAVESDTPEESPPTPTPTPSPTEEAEPQPDLPPEVTSPAPPAGTPTPVPVPINPPTVPNGTPIPSPSPVTPGPGEF